MPPATRRLLAGVSDPGSVKTPSRAARPGTVLIREWQGVTHQVTVIEDGVRLSRQTLPLALRGRPPHHRRPLVGPALLRPNAVAKSRWPGLRRCAIYTRKSSEEGLEQDFNSLHAQREACEAYISSQQGEGWTPDRDRL